MNKKNIVSFLCKKYNKSTDSDEKDAINSVVSDVVNFVESPNLSLEDMLKNKIVSYKTHLINCEKGSFIYFYISCRISFYNLAMFLLSYYPPP